MGPMGRVLWCWLSGCWVHEFSAKGFTRPYDTLNAEASLSVFTVRAGMTRTQSQELDCNMLGFCGFGRLRVHGVNGFG